MLHIISLDDSDVLFMEEETGNIIVPREKLPPRIHQNDSVRIYFKEDTKNVYHEYTIVEDDNLNDIVTLEWISFKDNQILTEAPKFINKIKNAINPDMATKIKRGEKAAKKIEKQQFAKFSDMIKQEVAKGKNFGWEFHIQLPNGKNISEPLSFDDVSIFYKGGNNLNPAIVNAIVTLSKPEKFLFRKGKESFDAAGIRYAPSNAQVSSQYSVDWTEDDVADFKALVEEGSEKLKSTVLKALRSDKTKEEPKQDKGTDKKNTGGDISKNTYKHFLKILYVLRPKLYDAFDQPVDVSSTKELLDKVKYDNLADFVIEIDGKKTPVNKWIQSAVKNKVLMEKVLTEAPVIKFDDADINNPDSIDLKKIVARETEKEKAAAAEAERKQRIERFKTEYEPVYNTLVELNNKQSTEDVLEALFDKLVPSSGSAETVAGEYIRAVMRILYRDYNDGDKFFTSYGLESCGGSAEYLADEGFHESISEILDDAYRLADNDEAYTSAITSLAQEILDYLQNNEDLFYTENTVDSRSYSYEYIEEHQPTYEFECYGSDDVVTLVEKGVLTSWDLKNYVEDILSYESVYRYAKTERPWGHHDTSVTVSNLTRDAYDMLEDSFERNVDGFWEGLVEEYADELDDSDEEDYDDYDSDDYDEDEE